MESCSSTMEPWLTFWDNDAVARALQMSLSDDYSAAVSFLLPQSEPAVSDHSGHRRARNQTTSSPTAKIKKRKPRPSKRNTTAAATTTTYITADPANFREMVQQVTGVQGGPGVGPGPEQQRAGPGLLEEFGSCMPTLDTSAFLFEQAADGPGGLLGSGTPVGQTIDFGPFASFPTLESWGARAM